MGGSSRTSDFIPMAGLEAEVRDLIEQHLDVGVDDGLDAAAIVARMRELGVSD
jgi:hypothetical protein